MPQSAHELVDDEAGLDQVIGELVGAPRYAIDTEFHRERTYFPQLALVQIGWEGGLVLIDPLALDISPLKRVFETDAVAVLHASSQDLEVMQLATGTVPRRIFDTQIAAGFMGLRTPSLASLHDQLLGLKLPKANRLTDWLRRPLEPEQQSYAASDVANLLEIQDRIEERLEVLRRREWAEAECEIARSRGATVRDPAEAWTRIKEARSLGARARTAARELAAWREQTAQDRNIPVRHLLPDLAIVALSQRPPRSADDVGKARGLERRSLSRKDAAAVVEVIAASVDLPAPESRSNRSNQGPDLRPAVTLIAAWLSQYAEDHELDPALLGSRSDIEEFVRGGESRLSSGWRHDMAGAAIESLLAGDAAVAFDGDGRVVVERRSHEPIASARFSARPPSQT